MTWSNLTTGLRAITILLIVAIFVVGGYRLRQAQMSNADLARQVAALTETNSTLGQELNNNSQALFYREVTSSLLQKENDGLRSQLEDLYTQEPCIKDWADSRIPDSVFKRLRQ